MNLKNSFILLTTALALIASFEIEARGGRGGGGGGGRGGAGAARGGGTRGGSYARTPSMSRANINRNTPVNRPAATQINRQASQINRQPIQQRPASQINRQTIQRDIRQNIPASVQRPSQTQINTARQNFRNDYPNIRNSQRQVSRNVTNAIRNNRTGYGNYFNNNFYDRHGYRPGWYNQGYNAWAAASWAGVNNWLGWGWSDPYYYDDGGSYVEVPSDYANQYSEGSVAAPAAATQAQGDWMSLGVFAVSQDEKSAAYATKFVQIVVDKNGVLAGTLYNSATDQVHPLDGFIDKDSQQAVWRIADNANSPIMTTGIFNLTQDVADVKARYSNGNEQYWKMIRLEQ